MGVFVFVFFLTFSVLEISSVSDVVILWFLQFF